MVDIVVDGTPKACLIRTRQYFIEEWPFRGEVYTQNNAVRYSEYLPEQGTLFDTVGGWIVFLFLAFVTATAFAWVYVFYVMIFKWREAGVAEVFATPDGSSRTHLTVSANRRKLSKTLEQWVKDELAEKQGALAVEIPLEAADSEEQDNTIKDIPAQLRDLAQLKEQKIISDDEFEAKKKDLLDRM